MELSGYISVALGTEYKDGTFILKDLVVDYYEKTFGPDIGYGRRPNIISSYHHQFSFPGDVGTAELGLKSGLPAVYVNLTGINETHPFFLDLLKGEGVVSEELSQIPYHIATWKLPFVEALGIDKSEPGTIEAALEVFSGRQLPDICSPLEATILVPDYFFK